MGSLRDKDRILESGKKRIVITATLLKGNKLLLFSLEVQ